MITFITASSALPPELLQQLITEISLCRLAVKSFADIVFAVLCVYSFYAALGLYVGWKRDRVEVARAATRQGDSQSSNA